jgi:hypothetical protein
MVEAYLNRQQGTSGSRATGSPQVEDVDSVDLGAEVSGVNLGMPSAYTQQGLVIVVLTMPPTYGLVFDWCLRCWQQLLLAS